VYIGYWNADGNPTKPFIEWDEDDFDVHEWFNLISLHTVHKLITFFLSVFLFCFVRLVFISL
jgi:hypothetical protein